MWNVRRNRAACRAYEARLESYLDARASGENTVLVAVVEAHLKGCARCRQALGDARMAGELLRGALEPAGEPSGAFVSRVAARIRQEESRRLVLADFWRPLELLASRLAVGAAIILMALTVYLFEYGPAPRRAPAVTQTEITEGLPEPPAQPANKDEVLLSLAERTHGQ